jgi:hypothetical protein
MGDIVKFPASEGRIIGGKFVREPKNREEYLSVCKSHLSIPKYEMLLLAIMDKEYYDMADYGTQGVVDAYKVLKP